MGAILWCCIGRLVFAASVQQLATTRDQIMISSADIAAKAPFAPIAITGGVLVDEAMQSVSRVAGGTSLMTDMRRDGCYG
jgi:hypothetical protein